MGAWKQPVGVQAWAGRQWKRDLAMLFSTFASLLTGRMVLSYSQHFTRSQAELVGQGLQAPAPILPARGPRGSISQPPEILGRKFQ